MNDEQMYSEEPVIWNVEAFHSWLMEEVYRFRKTYEGPNYEFADKTMSAQDWGKEFRIWLDDNI